MDCSVYDINLNRVGVVNTWVSLVWEESYNSDAEFQLELQQTEDVAALFLVDRYVRYSESDVLMIIKSVQISGGTVVVAGYPATQILDDRVSTAVISNQQAEPALRALFSEADAWPRLELGERAGLTDVFTAEKSDASLLEYFQIICQATDMGYRFRHDKAQRKLFLELYKPGENANARFSTLYGNLGEITYSKSTASLKNVAVVAGSGEGASRITVLAGDTESTGENRHEMYVDARNEQPEEGESDAEYKARLVRYGEEKLVGQIQIETFDFEFSDETVALGDIVTCNVPEIGVKLKARVVKKIFKSQQNVLIKSLEIGEPIILRRW